MKYTWPKVILYCALFFGKRQLNAGVDMTYLVIYVGIGVDCRPTSVSVDLCPGLKSVFVNQRDVTLVQKGVLGLKIN